VTTTYAVSTAHRQPELAGHRPRARPDDSAHARAKAVTGHSQHLQRLLVLRSPVCRRPLAWPARGDQRGPLGSEHAWAARGVGCGRLFPVPRVGPAVRWAHHAI